MDHYNDHPLITNWEWMFHRNMTPTITTFQYFSSHINCIIAQRRWQEAKSFWFIEFVTGIETRKKNSDTTLFLQNKNHFRCDIMWIKKNGYFSYKNSSSRLRSLQHFTHFCSIIWTFFHWPFNVAINVQWKK